MPPHKMVLPSRVKMPATVGEVSKEFEARIREGRLEGYRPISTGFPELDRVLGGGFLSGCEMLLAGRQNVGKTIWVLQSARNVALSGDYSCVVCYEHDEVHLFHRLLCMESYLAAGPDEAVTLMDIRQAVLAAVEDMTRPLDAGEPATYVQGLQAILEACPGARKAWVEGMVEYLDRLFIVRGDPVQTTLKDGLRPYARWLHEEFPGRAVLFIDYLQKAPLSLDSQDMDPDLQVIRVTQGIKDSALDYGLPIVAISALDPEGLKREEPGVEYLLGHSAVKYEPDVVILMQPHWAGGKRDVGFIAGKNRAGPTDVEVVYRLVGQHFCFDPTPVEVRDWARE
jgi:replicative DNA helicase